MGPVKVRWSLVPKKQNSPNHPEIRLVTTEVSTTAQVESIGKLGTLKPGVRAELLSDETSGEVTASDFSPIFVVPPQGITLTLVDTHPVDVKEETSGIDSTTVKKELLRVNLNGSPVDFSLFVSETTAILVVNTENLTLREKNNVLTLEVLAGGCKDRAGNPFDADRDPNNGIQTTAVFNFDREEVE